MPDRFFTAAPIIDERATLFGPEAHHLAHVMRAQVGQIVTLFDGSGCEFTAEITTLGKREIQLAVLERREVNRESSRDFQLAVALPKGERQQWLVEKAVELGVTALIPLETKRGVAQPLDSALERLRRTVIEASKQCGRNRLLEVKSAQLWQVFIASQPSAALRLVAHPGGSPLQNMSPREATYSPERGVIAAVGPEGGFTEEEIAAALAVGWLAVDLGPRILRVETAAIALAGWAIYSR
jgi:16S rRNA (uracil1498-N3)-methyltransferase